MFSTEWSVRQQLLQLRMPAARRNGVIAEGSPLLPLASMQPARQG